MVRHVLLAALLTAPLSFGQESRGSIRGLVTDSSGAIVVGTRVQAINIATNAGASSVTNEHGNYEIPYLLPGMYRVVAEMAGFKKAIRDQVELRVNDRLTLDFALQIGDAAETVVVTGETPLLEAATASVGMVMDQRRISELPIMGGNPIYLSRLSPGVASNAGRGNGHDPYNNGSGTTLIVVNGTRSGSSEVTMDGLPNMSGTTNFYAPPQDMVQEFKIHTSTYDASLGHAAGAVTNISTKSGTNALHGSGWIFQDKIKAIPWFSNKWLYDPTTGPINDEKKSKVDLPFAHDHDGVAVAGPIVIPRLYNGRNRAFFSAGYERAYQSQTATFTGTVPIPEQVAGNFSSLLKLGAVYQIYDPKTIAAAAGGRFSRLPLAGNIIPASRIDPMAKKLAEYWPAPNAPATTDGQQNYFRALKSPRLWRAPIGRVDYNLSDKHRIFVRGNYFNFKRWFDPNLETVALGNLTPRKGYGGVIDDVYVFNPQLLLNLRAGVNVNDDRTIPTNQGFDLAGLGFPQSLMREILAKNNPGGIAFPQITVTGLTGIGGTGGSTTTTNYQTLAGTVTRIKGNHSMRFGAEYRLMRENGYAYGNVAPRVDFGTNWTRGPVDNSTAAPMGQALASMLFGLPTGGQINVNASRAEHSGYTSVFVQDDWRVSRRLTVNVGLRYEYESAPTERFNRSIRGFDFEAQSPITAAARANYAASPIPEVPVAAFRTIGGLTFVGATGQPRGLWSADSNNFAPRIGLAYTLSSKTVVRSGYGVFYVASGIDRQAVNQGGFSQTTNLVPSQDNGLTFRATLSNPFPDGFQLPDGASGGLRTFLGRGISFFNEKSLNPYMQRWSLSVQQELPFHILTEVGYVGNRGNKLAVSRNINAIPRQYLSTLAVRDQPVIDMLSTQVRNPFYGLPEFVGSGMTGINIGRSSLLRPYPQFGDITATQPNGFSWYHSLQMRMEKRLAKGFLFQSAWTWSKFMEATSYRNDTDSAPEHVISSEDYPHRFTVTAIYELPFGKGKFLFGKARGWINYVIGGWQIEGWYEGQSGKANGFGNAIFTGDLHNIPIPVGQRSVERWFNVDAGFDRDTRRQLANNIQTLSTLFTGVRSDGINNLDASIHKSFPIKERVKLDFRMQAANALNHAQFNNPNTAPTNTAFGTITTELGHGQRQVYFSIKAMF
jgi:hypothetical protein